MSTKYALKQGKMNKMNTIGQPRDNYQEDKVVIVLISTIRWKFIIRKNDHQQCQKEALFTDYILTDLFDN